MLQQRMVKHSIPEKVAVYRGAMTAYADNELRLYQVLPSICSYAIACHIYQGHIALEEIWHPGVSHAPAYVARCHVHQGMLHDVMLSCAGSYYVVLRDTSGTIWHERNVYFGVPHYFVLL